MALPSSPARERWLTLRCHAAAATTWAPAGFELCAHQLCIPAPRAPLRASPPLPPPARGLQLERSAQSVRMCAPDAHVIISAADGAVLEWVVGGRSVLARGGSGVAGARSLSPSLWRAPLDNDEGGEAASYAARWRKHGPRLAPLRPRPLAPPPPRPPRPLASSAVARWPLP